MPSSPQSRGPRCDPQATAPEDQPPAHTAPGRARRLLARLLGRRCPVCGIVSRDPGLCPACAAALTPRLGGFCPDCGEIYEDPTEPPVRCFPCRETPRPWESLTFHGPYQDALRHLILGYKFYAQLGHGRVLRGLLLAAHRRGPGQFAAERLLVPVPLHTRRLRRRGFNQSLELAKGLAKEPGLTLAPEALSRTRHTVPQSGLAEAARLTNLKQAFAADENLVSGRRILLVDDVTTTGATLEEAAYALLRAGAAGVDCLVLAKG